MATSIKELTGFLTKNNVKFQADEAKTIIRTGFITEKYVDPDGDHGIFLVVSLEENGEFFKLMAPRVYSYPDGPNKQALFQACLMVSWMTKMIQFEYDPSDGEVRAIIEFPLEDAPMTERQFMRCLRVVPQLVDEYDAMIRKAMQEGVVEQPEQEDPEELMRAFMEFMEQRKRDGGKPPVAGSA